MAAVRPDSGPAARGELSETAASTGNGSAAPRTALLDGPIAFVDVETTGGDARFDRVIEIGIVSVRAGVLEHEWSTLINPECRMPPHIEALTGIDDAMPEDAPTFAELAAEIAGRLEDRLFVAHSVSFDRSFLRNELKRAGRRFSPRSLCTVRLSRRLFPQAQSLCAVALGIEESAGSCVAHQLGRCRGACLGTEPVQLRATRVRLALAPLRVRNWPFTGALGVRERSGSGRTDIHVFHHWRLLGTAHSDDELAQLLAGRAEAPFDVDIYRIVARFLRGRRRRGELIDLRLP